MSIEEERVKVLTVLVDMDDVIADWSGHFFELAGQIPELRGRLIHSERKSFSVLDDYPKELEDAAREIYESEGFFRDLKPVDGAIEAIHELSRLGHNVLICTAPLHFHTYCVTEKFDWVQTHLGAEFKRQMILAKYKKFVHGDYLIDDNPNIRSLRHEVPSWQHILYTQPYNMSVTDRPRITWTGDWKSVLRL